LVGQYGGAHDRHRGHGRHRWLAARTAAGRRHPGDPPVGDGSPASWATQPSSSAYSGSPAVSVGRSARPPPGSRARPEAARRPSAGRLTSSIMAGAGLGNGIVKGRTAARVRPRLRRPLTTPRRGGPDGNNPSNPARSRRTSWSGPPSAADSPTICKTATATSRCSPRPSSYVFGEPGAGPPGVCWQRGIGVAGRSVRG